MRFPHPIKPEYDYSLITELKMKAIEKDIIIIDSKEKLKILRIEIAIESKYLELNCPNLIIHKKNQK